MEPCPVYGSIPSRFHDALVFKAKSNEAMTLIIERTVVDFHLNAPLKQFKKKIKSFNLEDTRGIYTTRRICEITLCY